MGISAWEYLQIQRLRIVTLRAYRKGDWRRVPINENSDPLVLVPREITFPFYAQSLDFTEGHSIYLRREVLGRILRARKYLAEKRFDIRVYDGWRSLSLQEQLFWHNMREFTAGKFKEGNIFYQCNDIEAIKRCFYALPSKLQSEMFDSNRRFVSWPSRDFQNPSPHTTGGAVDVWLVNRDGQMLDLGTPFDWMEEEAGAFYHLKLIRRKFSDEVGVCYRRSLLILAMTSAGFSCYGPEFWHFNYGNQMDALVKGGAAAYSYVEPSRH